MKIKSWPLAIIVLAVFFGGIALSAAFNLWKTESTKTPAKIKIGEFTGDNDPSDIRGSYSFADIEKAFDIPVDVLAKAFGVSYVEDPAGLKAKNIEELYRELEAEDREIGTDAVKLFVALYTGLPHTPEETTILPNPAVSILKQLGTLTEEQLGYLEEIKIDISQFKGEITPDELEEVETHEESAQSAQSEDRTIKGKTTFNDLLEWGLSKENIEAALGMEMGARPLSIRDFCKEKEIEFSSAKAKLQSKVDALD
jgi:hypothetical protein